MIKPGTLNPSGTLKKPVTRARSKARFDESFIKMEDWYDIPNAPGYAVSRDGRILSKGRWTEPGDGSRSPCWLTPSLVKVVRVGKYWSFRVHHKGQSRSIYLRQVLAEVFLGPCPEGYRLVDSSDPNLNMPTALRHLSYQKKSTNPKSDRTRALAKSRKLAEASVKEAEKVLARAESKLRRQDRRLNSLEAMAWKVKEAMSAQRIVVAAAKKVVEQSIAHAASEALAEVQAMEAEEALNPPPLPMPTRRDATAPLPERFQIIKPVTNAPTPPLASQEKLSWED